MADTNAQQFLIVQQHLEQGRVGEALSDLQVWLLRHPEDGKAQALYGQILFQYLSDFTAAEEAFRISMRLTPAFPDLYYGYAALLLRLDKGTETVAVLNRSLEVPGIEKDRIYQLFGRLYEREGKWEDAMEYFLKAVFYSFEEAKVAEYRKDVERVRSKMNL